MASPFPSVLLWGIPQAGPPGKNWYMIILYTLTIFWHLMWLTDWKCGFDRKATNTQWNMRKNWWIAVLAYSKVSLIQVKEMMRPSPRKKLQKVAKEDDTKTNGTHHGHLWPLTNWPKYNFWTGIVSVRLYVNVNS